jgi:hypothetical protein
MLNNQLNVLEGKFELVDIEERFSPTEFSSGLSELSGKKVMFRTDFAKECFPMQTLGSSSRCASRYPQLPFSELPHDHKIAAVDSSCILIGETEEGAIYAGRVSTVLSSGRKTVSYCRAGPAIFYITPQTIRSILGPVFYSKTAAVILMDRKAAERFVRTHLERTALLAVAGKLSDGIVLVDGALRTSSLERDSLTELERTCQEHGNQLVGISKSSSIKIVTGAASDLQASPKGDVYTDLTEPIRALFPLASGRQTRIVAAKFSSSSPVFRVDFSGKNSEEDCQVLCDLKFNDCLFRGYPESLRLAHHLSVFDSSIVASVRSYLSKNYGLVRVPSDDLRATILGKLL